MFRSWSFPSVFNILDYLNKACWWTYIL
jgi:hypothetical protein